jgi:hypothetical protein
VIPNKVGRGSNLSALVSEFHLKKERRDGGGEDKEERMSMREKKEEDQDVRRCSSYVGTVATAF